MSGGVLFVHQLFKDYLFALPAIQRPYDWQPEDAIMLLEDLLSALGAGSDGRPRRPVRELEIYILGSINLAQGSLVPGCADTRRQLVVDGQQRIVTLCLLFAALRERFLESDAEEHVQLAREIEEMLLQVGKGA